MSRQATPYWGRFALMAAGLSSLLFLFVFGFLPQRFILHLDFNEAGASFPVLQPRAYQRPHVPERHAGLIPRGPAERFWAEYAAHRRAGDEAAALATLRVYLAGRPDDDAVRLEEARLLAELGRTGEALSAFKDLIARDPADFDLLREAAELAVTAGEYEVALDLYRRRGDLYRIAQILYWTGKPEDAVAALDSLPESDARGGMNALRVAIAAALPPSTASDSSWATVADRLERARRLALEGAPDSALALYRTILAAAREGEGPNPDSLRLEMADVFEYRAGQPDSAIAYLRAYLDDRPEDVSARLRLARRLAWAGRTMEARETLERLLARDPENGSAWSLLGELRRWDGSRNRARAAYRQALALNPGDTVAQAGLEAIDREVESRLAGRGTIGPSAGLGVRGDSDEFTQARWSGEFRLGNPRSRAALAVELESLSGRDLEGGGSELLAAEAQARAETWLSDGSFHVSVGLGLWVPEGDTEAQPTGRLALTAPDLAGMSLRAGYSRGPAYRETSTLEAALTGLSSDAVRLDAFASLGGPWELRGDVGVAHLSGGGDSNWRGTAGVDLVHRVSPRWSLGYETRALAFADPAPRMTRRLYWDPAWYWSHAAVVSWEAAPAAGWRVGLRAAPGIALLDERDGAGPMAAPVLGALADVERRLDRWTLQATASYTQSRTNGYRAFELQLGAARSLGGAR